MVKYENDPMMEKFTYDATHSMFRFSPIFKLVLSHFWSKLLKFLIKTIKTTNTKHIYKTLVFLIKIPIKTHEKLVKYEVYQRHPLPSQLSRRFIKDSFLKYEVHQRLIIWYKYEVYHIRGLSKIHSASSTIVDSLKL